MNPFIGRNFRLDGNQLALKLGNEIKLNIQNFKKTNQMLFQKKKLKIHDPKLQIINVGHNIGSLSYIRKKIQMAQILGIRYHLHQFNVLTDRTKYNQQYQQVHTVLNLMNKKSFSKYELQLQHNKQNKDSQMLSHKVQNQLKKLQNIITKLNQDNQTSALFIQLPLHQYLKPFTQQLINKISDFKDADCLTKHNRMRVLDHKNIPKLLPCTPRGVIKILQQNKIQIKGMNAVMIGRSDLVGKPLSHLLLNKSATTIICHSETKDVNFFTKDADLVISAAGVPNLIQNVKKNSILIDIGISRDSNGKISGDICNQAKKLASFYTPVPGGVGPLTVVMLMENVYHLWKAQQESFLHDCRICNFF